MHTALDTPPRAVWLRWGLSTRDLALLLLLFAITRFALVAVGSVAALRLPTPEGEQFTHLLDGGAPLDMWYRQDAGFYTTIATLGYDWANERRPADDMAFLPLYPAFVRLASGVGLATGGERCPLSPYLSTCATLGGLLVSNLALLANTLLLFGLARRRFGAAVAWRAVILLLVTFNSIFLSGVYTESLFLLWVLLTFWGLEREQFALALLCACLACLTRSVGVALFPALLVYAWGRRSPAQMALSLLPPLIFAGYILGIGLYVGDPLAYFRAYTTTWGRASASPIEAFTVYFSGQSVSWFGWGVSWIDLAFTLLYLAFGIAVWRLERTWGAFALAAVVIPIATGTLLSMPRFGAIIFPFYLLLARWGDARWKQALLYGANAALWLLFVTRFVSWRWIA